MSKAFIRSLVARKLDVPMKKAFGISGGAQEEAKNVLVSLGVDGMRGWGEGAPFPAFNGETQSRVLLACTRAETRLVGLDLHDDHAIRDAISETCSDSPSARCAIETAVFDVRARLAGRSLRDVFGGAEHELVTDITITTGTVEQASEEAREFAAFRTLKVKIGGTDVDRDVARVRAIRAARPDARIIVDANGGMSVDEAVRFADEVREVRVELFEQPVKAGNWEALAEVRKRSGLRIAIDESVTCAADVSEAKRHGAANTVNAKIMKSGIFEVLAIAERARAEGLERMIGGMVETRLAMGMSACMASGLGGFFIVDLDTPLFLAADPFVGGYVQEGERIDVRTVDVGHGLAPTSTWA